MSVASVVLAIGESGAYVPGAVLAFQASDNGACKSTRRSSSAQAAPVSPQRPITAARTSVVSAVVTRRDVATPTRRTPQALHAPVLANTLVT